MWHGGGLTGVTYETKPDGEPGWLNYFLRAGWDTYISDAVERGRSGWTDKFKGEPIFLPLGDPWERFRVGPVGSWNDDKAQARDLSGRPIPDRRLRAVHEARRAALDHDRRSDRRRLYRAGRQGLPLRRAGPLQAGNFGYRVAEARPDKVKALVVGRALGARHQGQGRGAEEHPDHGDVRRQRQGSSALGQDPAEHVDYVGLIKGAGGSVDFVDLPDIGIKGNTHMLMMDKNSDEVAEVIQKWLVGKGLAE